MIGENFQGFEDGIVVVEGFAHAHEDEIAEAGGVLGA